MVGSVWVVLTRVARSVHRTTHLLVDSNSSEYPDPGHVGKLGSHRHPHAKGCLHQAILEWRT